MGRIAGGGAAPCAAVVGAGPHGLIAARALRSLGVDVTIFEKHSDVGGIWDIENSGTPMYESCHFISSRKGTSYFDYPMPESYPDYPSRTQVLDYIRGFARTFDLYPLIRFNAAVIAAHAQADGKWNVNLANGEDGVFDALVCCPGSNWAARMPSLEGAFSGRLIHSVDYKRWDELTGKRVLIIGLGNSGADIACDAARVAAKAMVSVRRGYHIVPKHVFGIPLLDFMYDPGVAPKHLRGLELGDLIKVIVGDPSRFGMPRPDHALLESHPLVNTEILHHLGHGRLHIKGAVERLEGRQVRFQNGDVEDVDVIICATGYDHAIPFLDPSYFEWVEGRPQLYLTAFNRAHPTLFAIGLLEAAGVPYAAGDQLALFIGEYLRDRAENPERAAKFENLLKTDFPDLKAGMRYVETNRTANYVNVETYFAEIERVRALMDYTPLLPGRYLPPAIAKSA